MKTQILINSKIPLKSIKTRLINISKNFFSIVFLKNIHFPQFIHKC